MSRHECNLLVTAGLVTAAVIYLYPLSLPTPLLEPDEGLHAAISQEMLERDSWIVPSFRDEPFLDKPILYFWAQMLSLKVFGMHTFAVRLPGLLFGLLGAITTGMLAGRLFGSEPCRGPGAPGRHRHDAIGLVAGLMALTMIIPLALAQFAVHDVALVPFSNLVLLSLWNVERSHSRRDRNRWSGTAAAMMGLAILTKALIGVAIVSVGYVTFLALRRKLTIAAMVRFGCTLAGGLLFASPWYLAMELRSSGYLYYYFVERHLLGFTTTTQHHGLEPWYYYLPWLILGTVPWIGYLIPLAIARRQNRGPQIPKTKAMLFLLCWLVGGTVFLSVAKSKLVTYALPLFPALAILAAVSWQRFISDEFTDGAQTWFVRVNRWSGIAGTIVPPGALVVLSELFDASWPPVCWILGIIISAVSLISWRAFEGRQYVSALALCCLWFAGTASIIVTWPMQTIADHYSQKGLADWINTGDQLPAHLVMVDETPASVIFYLKPELRQRLQQHQFSRRNVDTFSTATELDDSSLLAVTQESLEQAADLDIQLPGILRVTTGRYLVFECDNAHLSVAQTTWRSQR